MTTNPLNLLCKNPSIEKVRLANGVAMLTLPPELFDGECDRRSFFYEASMCGVSALAMLTNLGQALTRKVVEEDGLGIALANDLQK